MSRVPRPPPPSSPADEEEDDFDEGEEEDEFGEMIDPMEALGSFLATEDGDTIATALVGLKEATEKIAVNMEMQNKILVKMLSAIGKCQGCACQTTESPGIRAPA
jgi:hypothetical protein